MPTNGTCVRSVSLPEVREAIGCLGSARRNAASVGRLLNCQATRRRGPVSLGVDLRRRLRVQGRISGPCREDHRGSFEAVSNGGQPDLANPRQRMRRRP